jgi:NADH dehydrogenase
VSGTGRKKQVVIVGGGFAGLAAAKILASEPVHVTVVDRNNHHLFQPLLYQVATAGLSPADIAMPIRSVLRNTPDTEVIMASAERLDVAERKVYLDHGDVLDYDYLLLATGARHSYFGHPEWESLAPGLKTLEDATEIRRRILLGFEAAERAHTPEERDAQLTFVVVGGGPTGVEVAGAIGELARFSLAQDFDHINPRLARIIIIEAGPRLLATFPETLADKAKASLEKLGVTVMLGKRVTDVSKTGVIVDGALIAARTVIWAAGVEPSKLGRDLGVPLDRAGRVLVQPDLSIPGHPEVFVCGDLAAVPWKDGQLVPGQAPGAMQEGRHAARNIMRLLRGEPTAPFRYLDKGQLATIGRAHAIAELGKARISGFLAWLIWLFVHILYLIGFRNRLIVLIEWAWSYFSYQKGTRLITGRSAALPRPADGPGDGGRAG